MHPVAIEDWRDFFVGQVGASAALTGLLVVAVSINLSRSLALAQLSGRAGEALFTLVGLLVLTSVGLFPNQSGAAFGVEASATGATMFLVPFVNQGLTLRSMTDIPRSRMFARIVANAVAYWPIVVGGMLLLLGSGAGFYWVAGGVILSLVAGVLNAWVLLVEILR